MELLQDGLGKVERSPQDGGRETDVAQRDDDRGLLDGPRAEQWDARVGQWGQDYRHMENRTTPTSGNVTSMTPKTAPQ
ncbi:hypothetical protein ACFU7Y_18600 [Kitasatospora sp. NPDC057542]|uniref:hypothetical protein n=1 Tax=Kitasatospora sp. NPDC057542 TaxID=3346162 RepID=UPI0036A91510